MQTWKAPAFSMYIEDATRIYEWHSGQEVPNYAGECVCYFPDLEPALFRTFVRNGERHWICLKVKP